MAIKSAVISPAIAAQQMGAQPQDETHLFEEKFGQMAYQAFSSKFPDLVPDIVTFKILDTQVDEGGCCGAFILEQEGEFIYIPVVLAENELKPFDLMYIKSKDIFLPLTSKWLEEVQKNTVASLGTGTKLPDTVAKDVDIRNVVVPPMSGRASYASYAAVEEARATEPLGRRLHKNAELGNFPEADGAAQTGFDPQMWAGFVQQYQSTQGVSPGQALDSGVMDIDSLNKLYKSHAKTWSSPTLPTQQAQAPAPQQAQPGMPPKMASEVTTIGKRIDKAISNAVRSGALGAASGGVWSAADGDFSDMPSGMMRGAMGGALMGPLGNLAGEEIHARWPTKAPLSEARSLGRGAGSALGGILGADSEPMQVQIVPRYGEDPGMFSRAASLVMPAGLSMAGLSMMRTASDYQSGLRDMIKHALAVSSYQPFLPQFLNDAPNAIKKAFVQILDKHPPLLKKAADLYGEETLVACLQPHAEKTAGSMEIKRRLNVADRDTKPGEYRDYFGEGAPFAYQNVLKRGYYYEDQRPNLKMAMQVQGYHDFQNTLQSGFYRLFTAESTPEPALVIVEPLDLFGTDRATFPHDYESRVKPVRLRIPKTDWNVEPYALTRSDFEDTKGPSAQQRGHTFRRLAILDDRRYVVTTNLYGEQVAQGFIRGSSLANTLDDAKGKPRQGKGVWVGQIRGGWAATMPVEVRSVSEGSNGIVRGKMTDEAGFADKPFIIDYSSTRNRIMRPVDGPVIIPSNWRWVPLSTKMDVDDFISDPGALQEAANQQFAKDPSIKVATIRKDPSGLFTLGQESRAHARSDALQKLALAHDIHASAAESMLKIADVYGVCRAYVMTPAQAQRAQLRMKIAQGALPPQVPQGMPPAMAAPAPAPMPAPIEAAPPAPPPPSPVDQAFSESIQGLSQQMSELQAQLSVLQSVQQRAMEIESGQGAPPGAGAVPGAAPAMPPQGAPPDPGMQATDPAMQGAGAPAGAGMAPVDPNAAMGMQDPNAAPPDIQLPIMRTEEPSSEEIAQQINPDFLASAGQLHETGAFDAATIASLAQSNSRSFKSLTGQYAANLENSVDDLGRTLLTLYMQESKLKTQLGDETYLDLETQLRDTFHGLGRLVLAMTHNSAMLEVDATS